MEGLILRGIGSFYTVLADDGEYYTLRAQKKLRRMGTVPTVGDRVSMIPPSQSEEGWIESILPRKNLLKRPPVANIDLIAAVIAPVPEPDLLLLERLILQARTVNAVPMICVNKTDMGKELLDRMLLEFRNSEIPVYGVSTVTGEGIHELRKCLEGKIVCFAGQSAVGKSSLINALTGSLLETSGISRKTQRGRHTTRRCELIGIGKGYLADTPGFSLFELKEDLLPEELGAHYPEYSALENECRFHPCFHDREPGCAVRKAVEMGTLSQERLERYRLLLNEAKENRKGRYS